MFDKIEIYLNRKLTDEDKSKINIIGDFRTGNVIKVSKWNLPEPKPSIEELETIDVSGLIEQRKINGNALQFLNLTDWKVIRHRDQLAAGTETSLTQSEYETLLSERQAAREKVVN